MEVKQKSFKEIETIIDKAMKKMGCRKEADLCRYLPMNAGGYMHHFTLRKMKKKQPQELSEIIEKFVLGSDKPSMVAPKQRAPRGSRKRRDPMNFTRTQLERMLSIAKMVGDKEIVSILSPKKSLAGSKRDLIQAIRNHRTDQELWNTYVESVHTYNATVSPLSSPIATPVGASN